MDTFSMPVASLRVLESRLFAEEKHRWNMGFDVFTSKRRRHNFGKYTSPMEEIARHFVTFLYGCPTVLLEFS